MNAIHVGALFPTKDIGADTKSILEFGPSSEALGLDFVATYDHVVGVAKQRIDAEAVTDCTFDDSTNVHETMITLTAMAARTERIRLVSACLVSPQRQTALVAKQAAELDIISGGRLDLGISIGWNQPEFKALGARFENRVSTLEEQVSTLRAFWSRGSDVTVEEDKQSYTISIEPKPLQQAVPIWIGGTSDNAAQRAAHIGDGWLPLGYIDQTVEQKAERYWETAAMLGRTGLKLMGRINPWRDTDEACIEQYQHWKDVGATHVAIGTSQGCFKSSQQYFDELGSFVETLR